MHSHQNGEMYCAAEELKSPKLGKHAIRDLLFVKIVGFFLGKWQTRRQYCCRKDVAILFGTCRSRASWTKLWVSERQWTGSPFDFEKLPAASGLGNQTSEWQKGGQGTCHWRSFACTTVIADLCYEMILCNWRPVDWNEIWRIQT